MNCDKTAMDARMAARLGQPLTLRIFQGRAIDHKDVAFEGVESAIRAFLATAESRIPHLRAGNDTLLELDPEAGFAPLFWGDDGSVAACFHRLAATSLPDAAPDGRCSP